MKNLILNFSWEAFSNLPPTEMFAIVGLAILVVGVLVSIAAFLNL